MEIQNILETINVTLIAALIFLFLTDTISGVYKAWRFMQFSSRGLRKLCDKLVAYSLAIPVSYVAALSMSAQFPILSNFGNAVVAMLIVTEIISIFENIGAIYPKILPNSIRKRLETLKKLNDGEEL